MDGWNTSFLLGWPIFRCYISFRRVIEIYTAQRRLVNYWSRDCKPILSHIPVLLVGMVHTKSHITTYYLYLVTWQFWWFLIATEDITQRWLSIFWEPSRCIYTHRRTCNTWFENYHKDMLQSWLFMNNYNIWSTILRWCIYIYLPSFAHNNMSKCRQRTDHK